MAQKQGKISKRRHTQSCSSWAPNPDEPIAPDGGWGWVILFASFISSVIVDGVCFSFGIFYLEFLNHFRENKGKTAWIGSVLNGTYMIMGPVAGALANRFGCRAVAIAGGIWASVAFFLSTLCDDVNCIILTYGVLGGMGFGLLYLPSIVIVGFYFDKKRAFATGVATCGSGIGAFIFAPLCKFLIDEYAWRGAMWVVSAIVLNGIVLGSLYRPLTLRELEKIRRKFQRRQERLRQRTISERDNDEEDSSSEEVTTTDSEQEMVKSSSSVHKTQNRQIQLNTKTKPKENGFGYSADVKRSDRQTPVRKRTISNSLVENGAGLLSKEHTPNFRDSWHSLSGFVSSMESIPRTQSTPNLVLRGTVQQSKNPSCLSLVKEILQSIRETMDFTMLKNPVFVIYGLSCILCMAGFFVPFIYLPDKAIGLGNSTARGAFLLSVLGITNTIGRVMAGWVSDRPWADCLFINNIALIIGGLATIACPFCNTYVLLVLYACVFGLCIAAFVSLRSIILVDLIGLDKLTSAFGIIVLCQGITSFVGAPFAGFLYDITGNYNLSFYVAGTTIALAGIICFPLRRMARWRKELDSLKKANSEVHNTSVNKKSTDKDSDKGNSEEDVCRKSDETISSV